MGALFLLLPLVAAAACRGDDAAPGDEAPTPLPSPTSIPYTQPNPADTSEAPTEFRVAFINLLSPVALDANDPLVGDTYEERLAIVIEEVKALSPDLVAFTEASWTTAHGSARERLITGLKMEYAYARANPWFPGQNQEQSDQTTKLAGFEEGELVLSRYPILRAERQSLNPRTSETEGRVALHVVVKAPAPIGELDVYVTHLTGGADKVRQAQATDLLSYIEKSRGEGAFVIFADISDPPGSATYQAFIDHGLTDITPLLGGSEPAATCCREALLGQQPPPATRTEFVFALGWPATSATIFASTPGKRSDGTLLYASDHNGIEVVFPLLAVSP